MKRREDHAKSSTQIQGIMGLQEGVQSKEEKEG